MYMLRPPFPSFIDVSTVNCDALFYANFPALFLVLTEFKALLVKVGEDCGQASTDGPPLACQVEL